MTGGEKLGLRPRRLKRYIRSNVKTWGNNGQPAAAPSAKRGGDDKNEHTPHMPGNTLSGGRSQAGDRQRRRRKRSGEERQPREARGLLPDVEREGGSGGGGARWKRRTKEEEEEEVVVEEEETGVGVGQRGSCTRGMELQPGRRRREPRQESWAPGSLSSSRWAAGTSI